MRDDGMGFRWSGSGMNATGAELIVDDACLFEL